MESKCVVCHEKTARHRCLQCHKPICDSCAFKSEHGVFCGRECSAKYREYKQHAKGSKGAGGGLLKKAIVLIVVLAVAYVVGWKLEILPGPGQVANQAEEMVSDDGDDAGNQ